MIAALGLLSPAAIRAQSAAWGSVTGFVQDATGQPIARALVTLSFGGATTGSEATTDPSGRVTFSLLAPGTYEVRAEALGHRPVVARGLVLVGGEAVTVALRLSVAAPPVAAVDTVFVGGGGSARWRPGGVHFDQAELARLPDRFEDLSSVVGLASTASRGQGLAGLPGSMTVLVADGVPVHRAPHPLARSEELGDALFPRSAVSSVASYGRTPDVEWGGGGGYVALTSQSSARSGLAELSGSWSGDALWSSSELDFSAPSMTSLRGSGRTALEVSPSMSLFLGADAFQEESPLAPRIDDSVAPTLVGVDAALIALLSAPGTERLARYSALARADVQSSATSRLFVRGSVAYSMREFEGPGPVTLAGDASLPEESLDFSFAAGLVSLYRPGLSLELRAGVSRSDRTFDPAAPGMPAASLAASASALGALAAAGESSRTDFFLLPAVQYALAGGQLKIGATVRATAHTASSDVPQDLVYSDGPALVAARGFARALSAPEASYDTQELGGFARYDVEPTPAVRLTLGARYDHERLPREDVTPNLPWYQASGIVNDSFPPSLDQVGAVASLAWDASGDGATTVATSVALQHGDVDPRALSELLAQDAGATSTRYAGSGLNWPGGSIPGAATTLPTLTLLGPDTRAPRSLQASLGLSRRVLATWSLHVEGAYRRTDFLMRRRNLNVAIAPTATDPHGRDVFGTLQQDGNMVTATGADARRFAAFQEVWALDPDGWSEYRGVTIGLDHVGARAWLYASYTLSETTDNWIGVSRGSPYAELSPLLPASLGDWSEGASDYDARHRVSVASSYALGFATISATYRFRSGLPFTPGYRAGVDANGDGAFENDAAFVDAALVGSLLDEWPCLSDLIGTFASRNSCRRPAAHSLDARIEVGVGRVAGRAATIVLDALDLIESRDGGVDGALLLVDPAASITTGPGAVTIPVTANPGFGRVLYPSSRGRQLRIGFRIG